ncbi:MAG TPA: rhodanese-like domain-containing protein [Alphaproteobacteria bacterium]
MALFQLQELDAAATKDAVDGGEAVLIDVREPAEQARERIPGVPLIPLSAFDVERIRQLAGGKKVILHCASGIRSASAAAALHGAGITNVAHLKGGLPTWRAAGFKVESA